MKRILIVSGIFYSRTNRGIDIITSSFIEKKYQVTHLVFPVSKLSNLKKIKKIEQENFKQVWAKKSYFSFLGIMGKILPSFLLSFIIKINIRLKNINFDDFDLVILEAGPPLFLIGELNPQNKVILRISDVEETCFGSKRKIFFDFMKKGIERSDLILVPNELLISKYGNLNKIKCWKNGFLNLNENISKIITSEKIITFFGLAKIDYKLIEFLASSNLDLKFIIIGPYKNKIKRKNVFFTGYLNNEEILNFVKRSKCFLIPYSSSIFEALSTGGLTSKFYPVMSLGIPILTVKYGQIQDDNEKLNLFTFSTFQEANNKLNMIINRTFNKTKEIEYFLEDLKYENRILELERLLKEVKIL